MTHRERILAAIRGEVPDQLPWVPRLEFWHRARLRHGTLPTELKSLTLPEVAKRNIASISRIEQELHREGSTVDHVSSLITRFIGSLAFVISHVLLFAGWILLNIVPRADHVPFDPYPFPLLSLTVALEAII